MHTAPIKYLMTRKGDLVVSSAIQPKTRPNDRSMSSRQSNALKKKKKKHWVWMAASWCVRDTLFHISAKFRQKEPG